MKKYFNKYDQSRSKKTPSLLLTNDEPRTPSSQLSVSDALKKTGLANDDPGSVYTNPAYSEHTVNILNVTLH